MLAGNRTGRKHRDPGEARVKYSRDLRLKTSITGRSFVWGLTARVARGIVLVVAILLAIDHWFRYVPSYLIGSQEYLQAALAISHGNYFAFDNGFRPPLFPLLLAAAGENLRVMFAIHLVIGIIVSLLLFEIFNLITGRPALGLIVAIIYNLNPSTAQFQAWALATTLTTLFVTAGSLFAVRTCCHRSRLVPGVLLTSLFFSLASFARPEYQLMPLVVTAAVLILRSSSQSVRLAGRQIFRGVVAGLLPFLLLIIGWSTVNLVRFNWFQFSTLTGYDMTQFFGPYFNEAPARDKKLADIFLRYRTIHLRTTSWPFDIIWEARPAMLKATGMTDAQMSRELLRICFRIFLRHPGAYFKLAGRAFRVFWRPPLYARGCNWKDFRNGLHEVLAGRASWLKRLYAYIYLPFEFLYALALIGPLLWRRWRPLLWSPGVLMLNVVILYEAVFSSLGNPEDNNRYKVPVESLILGIAILLIYLLLRNSGQRRKEDAAGAGLRPSLP